VQKYTGDYEICGLQNGHFYPFLLVLAVFGGFLAKSGHFAGHISHDPLYILAQFKVWDGREPSELQSDNFGLCSKKS
jgi:hypothetical protein